MVLLEHPASIEDSDDSASDVSETVLPPFDENELPRLPDEVVEDHTNEVDDFLSDDDSPASLHLENGTPAIKPRPYQLEMVEESLSKNIIIAMDTGSGKTHWYFVHTCSNSVFLYFYFHLHGVDQAKWDHVLILSILPQANSFSGCSAVMRVQYELERILSGQVRTPA
jgi:hypothetical protein